MLTKRRFFASALLALVLLSAAACAQIDLAPYEIPDSAMAQITLIQPGLFLIRHDSAMNDGTVPTSVILFQNGQPIFSRQFDNDGDWRLFSTFLMSEACYGYVLADHGDPTLGRLFVRLTGSGPSPLLQLTDHRHSVRLMNFGIAFLYETDAACALQLLDWQGRLKVNYALDPALRYSMLGSTLLADGTLRALTVDRPRADSGESARMILRTFSNAGALRSEQDVQSPYIGGFNDTVAFASDGGLVVCTAPLADYKIQQIIRMDAQNNVLYQKTLSAPKTVVDISGAQPSPDGSVTLYGSAMANSRGLFTVFRLNLDARGNVAALDVRDFTTRATYLYSVKLDPLGNAYVVAQDYKHPIAVVPFEALPVCDNPGLTLTNDGI